MSWCVTCFFLVSLSPLTHSLSSPSSLSISSLSLPFSLTPSLFFFLTPSSPSPSLHLGPLHPVCPSFYSLNLNYTWTKDEYTFDYYVGVCVPPVSTSLSNCYVVQKTTEPDGEITFQCLGEDLDVQVTNTQSAYILSISLVYPSHLLSQAHTYYVDAH